MVDNDIRFVCEHFVHEFRHLVRYLGLPHNVLSSIEVNYSSDVRKTIYQCLRKVNKYYSLTRIDLCNGIEYASQNRLLIKKLYERWKLARHIISNMDYLIVYAYVYRYNDTFGNTRLLSPPLWCLLFLVNKIEKLLALLKQRTIFANFKLEGTVTFY